MKLNDIISKISKNIRMFSKKNLNRVAKEVDFIKRHSPLDGNLFFKIFTFGAFSLKTISLRNLTDFIETIEESVEITRQGLENRLKNGSVFLEKIFKDMLYEKCLSTIKCNDITALQVFSDVKACDATIIEINENLSAIWKGYGGNSSKAALKIQTIYSLRSNAIENIDIKPGVENDTTYTENVLKHVNPNELMIVDLGYFNKKVFNMFSEKDAYFLSKVKNNTTFYRENVITGKLEPFDFDKYLRSSNEMIDVYLYTKTKDGEYFEFRVIGQKLPENMYEEKLRKAKKRAKNQGRTLKKSEKEALKWTIMITNIYKDMVTAQALLQVYRIRWQIEILFKCWKSFGNIQDVKKAKEYYLKCLIFGRLIMCLIINATFSIFKYYYKAKYSKTITILMFYSTITNSLKDICINFSRSKAKLVVLFNILNRIAKKSVSEKRSRKSSEDMLKEYPPPSTLLE